MSSFCAIPEGKVDKRSGWDDWGGGIRTPVAGTKTRSPASWTTPQGTREDRRSAAPRQLPSGPMADPFTVLIMAAGRGTRMRSATPKVLHPVCGKPMVEWVIDAAREAGAGRVVCVTRPGDGVAEGLPDGRRGAPSRTRARAPARPCSPRASAVHDGHGGGPLRRPPARDRRADRGPASTSTGERRAGATILTTDQLDPAGYGRIVRGGDGEVERIVETKYTDGVPRRGARHPRGQPRHLRLRGRRALRGARRRSADDGGERYLTGRASRCSRADGGKRRHPRRADAGERPRRERPRRPDGGRARIAQRRILEQHARAGVTFLAARRRSGSRPA